MLKTRRGFTLIELLIVISIIGILSAILVAQLNVARAKGNDAAIKANFSSLRAQAAAYNSNNSNYGTDLAATACPTSGTTVFAQDSTIRSEIAEASNKSGLPATCAAGNGASASNGSAASSFAVSVPLKTNPSQSWCVDSNGYSGLGSAQIISFVAICN